MARKTDMEALVSHVFLMGRMMRDRLHKDAGAGQCSLVEMEALRYIKEAGKPHMREIAKNFHVTPPAATLMIDGLVKAKFLARVFDPKDRRTIRVTLTARGRQLLERGMARKAGAIKKIFGSLTTAERAEFISIIGKIIRNNT